MDQKTSQWTPLGHPTPTKLVVNNLETGKEYKFRVRAHNTEGESDFVESAPITAKDKFDVPGKPENLRKNNKRFACVCPMVLDCTEGASLQ